MESMKDFENELEESYKVMGDGETSTDELIGWNKVKEYLASKENLTVEVSGVVNKGVIAMVEGIRGFIPASRLSLKRVDDLNDFLNKEIQVRVITVDPEKKKLVLSAREILQEERAAAKAAKIAGVSVGSVVDGKVESLQSYGAFISLGDGISGLCHISQIATRRIKNPEEVLHVGDEVKVKVIKNENGKISLSIRALQEEKKKQEEEAVRVQIPKSEEIGTSLGDLLKGLKLD